MCCDSLDFKPSMIVSSSRQGNAQRASKSQQVGLSSTAFMGQSSKQPKQLNSWLQVSLELTLKIVMAWCHTLHGIICEHLMWYCIPMSQCVDHSRGVRVVSCAHRFSQYLDSLIATENKRAITGPSPSRKYIAFTYGSPLSTVIASSTISLYVFQGRVGHYILKFQLSSSRQISYSYKPLNITKQVMDLFHDLPARPPPCIKVESMINFCSPQIIGRDCDNTRNAMEITKIPSNREGQAV